MIRRDRSLIPEPKPVNFDHFKKFIRHLLREKKFNSNKTYLKQLSKGLSALYKNKCCYCETYVPEAASFLDIDHYRPKGKLADDRAHPGYYWLGYEWTNLLPVCQLCNRHKNSHFPIAGARVTEPPMVNGQLDWEECRVYSASHCREQPLLLHPEADEPKRHLAFRPDGRVYPKDRSPRGEATIDICKLNRGPLVIERRRLVDKFYEGIFTHLFMFKEKEIEAAELWHRLDNVFEKMKRSCENHRSFSRLGWFLYEEFERFFVQRLRAEIDELYARIVGEAFKRFGEHGTCRKAGTSSL